MTHSDHDPAAGGGDHDAHASHGGRSSSNEDADGDLAGIAAGQTPIPDLSPDSTAVLLALLMCAAFGALGGWLLRVSAQK